MSLKRQNSILHVAFSRACKLVVHVLLFLKALLIMAVVS